MEIEKEITASIQYVEGYYYKRGIAEWLRIIFFLFLFYYIGKMILF